MVGRIYANVEHFRLAGLELAAAGSLPVPAPPLAALTAPLVASAGGFPVPDPQSPLAALTAPLVASAGGRHRHRGWR